MDSMDMETLRTWLEEGRPVTILDVRPAAERAEWVIPEDDVTELEAGANRCAIS